MKVVQKLEIERKLTLPEQFRLRKRLFKLVKRFGELGSWDKSIHRRSSVWGEPGASLTHVGITSRKFGLLNTVFIKIDFFMKGVRKTSTVFTYKRFGKVRTVNYAYSYDEEEKIKEETAITVGNFSISLPYLDMLEKAIEVNTKEKKNGS